MTRFTVTAQATGVALHDTQADFAPIMIDFNQMNAAWPHRGIGKQHDACKAIGLNKLKPKQTLTLLDATAGLARDAFIFAKLGATVTMLERHPMLALMMDTALAKLNDTRLKQQLQFIFLDARSYLTTSRVSYDVIYLDPMFSNSDKRATVKKDMQLLQQLVGENEDAELLFALALTKAKKRVVVKRHKSSAFLGNRPPTHQIHGKSTRYDVYLTFSTDANSQLPAQVPAQ